MARAQKNAAGRDSRHSVQAIMDAALDLFSERDFASVTIMDITRRAGVAHSLVYYHFRNKEDLFHHTLRDLIERTMKNYEALHNRNSGSVELIDDWFDNNIQLSGPLRKMVKIMFDYSGPQQKSPSVDNAIRDFYRQETEILSSAIRRGIEEGVFHPVNAEELATFVSTHIDGIFFDAIMRREKDIGRAMSALKEVTWTLLGYDTGTGVAFGAGGGRTS